MRPWSRDHPRSRGVYTRARRATTSRTGSSPLARGLRGGSAPPQGAGGIIPARAGFTGDSEEGRYPGQDHPRSRGVYSRASKEQARITGSSPLARGLQLGGDAERLGQWIIPARAGFTATSSRCSPWPGDHPRSRGVYSCLPPRPGCMWGSSPLARGLRPHRRGGRAGEGIIPARAGFTRRPNGDGPKDRDHPRSRGVYEDMGAGNAEDHGSSPLARGLHGHRPRHHHQPRIIPARAGFTAAPSTLRTPSRDHPRSRGVYADSFAAFASSVGSSPLARGLRFEAAAHLLPAGIIPARAGFTGPCPACQRLVPDHPRSRGVYFFTASRAACALGSSPLARGLRVRARRQVRDPGIIPARAGFTPGYPGGRRAMRDHPRSRGVYAGRTGS